MIESAQVEGPVSEVADSRPERKAEAPRDWLRWMHSGGTVIS